MQPRDNGSHKAMPPALQQPWTMVPHVARCAATECCLLGLGKACNVQMPDTISLLHAHAVWKPQHVNAILGTIR
jgi:hypothetical protein